MSKTRSPLNWFLKYYNLCIDIELFWIEFGIGLYPEHTEHPEHFEHPENPEHTYEYVNIILSFLMCLIFLRNMSIGGSVVECSPATRAARVRFPADAIFCFLSL